MIILLMDRKSCLVLGVALACGSDQWAGKVESDRSQHYLSTPFVRAQYKVVPRMLKFGKNVI